jgi:lysozyme
MIDVDFTVTFIAGFEGFVDHVYRDAVGVETIGYGETRRDVIERCRQSGISQQDALELLKQRVQEFADAVERCITNTSALTPARHAALTSLAYNIGVGGFRDSTACKRFNAGDLAGVPEAMGWWNKGDNVVIEGLVRRRAAEGALFSEGAAPAAGPVEHLVVTDPGAGNDVLREGDHGEGVPPWPGRLMQGGVDGDDVRQVQRRLADRGWAIVVDARFGPKTDGIVRAFQGEKALLVDGVVGPRTWESLWAAPVT